jgi:hypothetical protein
MAYTTIDDPSAHFQALTYTGNATNRTLTFDGNSDLQADWFWFKERNVSSNWHQLYDTSRGIGTSSAPRLFTNDASAEENITNGSGVRSVGTNSVDIGTTAGVNGNTNTLVLWAWKANGGTTSSNTDGDITTTVQTNSTAGFSIITYTGNGNNLDTIGHGLGATPDFAVVKQRSSSSNTLRWFVKVPVVCGNSEILEWDTNNAKGDSGNGIETMSSSTITLGIDTGNANATNESSATYVCYAFKNIQGYSKIGKYTGNASADGPFVYTGFKPAWVMVKRTDSGSSWEIVDNKRSPINVIDKSLYADLNDSEYSFNNFDFLSNGFKLRNASSSEANNISGGTYIYMAFAEHPFVSSKGVPVTAR